MYVFRRPFRYRPRRPWIGTTGVTIVDLGIATLTGSGALTATAIIKQVATAALSGAGTIAAAASVTQVCTCSMSGTGGCTCTLETAAADQGAVVGLRGVPSLRTRIRPEVGDISGFGRISVLAAGRITTEARLTAEALITVELLGELMAEAVRLAIAAIRAGAEGLIMGEWAGRAWAFVAERVTSLATVEQCVTAGLGVDFGVDALLRPEENEEALLLAAAYLLTTRME